MCTYVFQLFRATGYVLAKVGKSIAFCVGVSAIGLQVSFDLVDNVTKYCVNIAAFDFCPTVCYSCLYFCPMPLLQFVVNRKQSSDDWKKIEDDARVVLEKVVPIAKQVCLLHA